MDNITVEDTNAIIMGEVRKGIARHHIDTMNEFYSKGIKQILTHGFRIEHDIENTRKDQPDIMKIRVGIVFHRVEVGRPQRAGGSGLIPMLPQDARTMNLTYSAPVRITALVTARAFMRDGTVYTKEGWVGGESGSGNSTPFQLMNIPVIIGSNPCHTTDGRNSKLPPAALMMFNEDPTDPGGYIIIRGVEYHPPTMESRKFNEAHIHHIGMGDASSRGRMRTWLEFLSRPGDRFDNSAQVIIILYTDGRLVCKINYPYFKIRGAKTTTTVVEFPFYEIFRLLGASTDYEIMTDIVYERAHTAPLSRIATAMLSTLSHAYNMNYSVFGKYDAQRVSDDIIDLTARNMASFENIDMGENNIKYVRSDLMRNIDKMLLPHIGDNASSRLEKRRYLGYLIRKMLLVDNKVLPPTSRDALANKRFYPAGVNFARMFKKELNLTVVSPFRRRATEEYTSNPFNTVSPEQILRSVLNTQRLTKQIISHVTAGARDLSTGTMKRDSSIAVDILPRRNPVSVAAALNTVKSPAPPSARRAKQTDRAIKMRAVQPSQIGFIDIIHSADTGDNVGLVKQLSLTTSVSPIDVSSGILTSQILENKKDIMSLDTVSPTMIAEMSLVKIFVNGRWIGCSKRGSDLADQYREVRRRGQINRRTTIYWDPIMMEVHFWVDFGRLLRPLLIVKREQTKTGIVQSLTATKDDLMKLANGTITIESLEARGVLEYISPDEQPNCHIAMSVDYLYKHKNDPLTLYTHCDVPAALFGIATLVTPFAQHNQAPRVVYATNHCRQGCGYAALNYSKRTDRDLIISFNVESPVVRTIANDFAQPMGANMLVAVAQMLGYNQEDSLVINAASIHSTLANVVRFTNYDAQLEKDERFMSPILTETMDLKPGTAYSKLVKGVPPIGTKLVKGDVIIGKVQVLAQQVTRTRGRTGDVVFMYADRSSVYRDEEDAIVHDIIRGIDDTGRDFIKVVLRSFRPTEVGDKFSSRAGQKGVCGLMLPESDMPYLESGLTPDIIMNPHAIPSRMTIGQLIESTVGIIGAHFGVSIDATIFRDVGSIDEYYETMEKLMKAIGMEGNGYHDMYCPTTGRKYKVKVFAGIVLYTRLQKFVKEFLDAVETGPTCILTRQPVSGRKQQGGKRIGEMERDCIMTHGATGMLDHIVQELSDGYTSFVCRDCGTQAVVNNVRNIYRCPKCGPNTQIASVRTAWSSKLFNQELNAIGINMRTLPEQYNV